MPQNQRGLLAGLGILALLLTCCLGVAIGSSLPRREQQMPMATNPQASRPTPTAVTTLPAPTQTPYVIVITPTPATPSATPVVPTDAPARPPTATPVPTLAPPPASSDLQALVAYAEAVAPVVDMGLAAAERDGEILKASEEDPDALCGGGLNPHPSFVADAELMADLLQQLESITPPPQAADSIHRPLRESSKLWGEALANINLSCQTENELEKGALRLGAVLQLGGAAINFRIAADNFVLLLIANGLEELATQ